ncbi:DUF4440 domain-containing protein [Chloroflexota bacterium]
MEIKKEDFNKLQELEESLWRSETRFNREYMENVLSPDFFEFGGSGRIYKREDTLSQPTQEIKAKLPLKDFTAHFVSENVILVTYVSEVEYDMIQIRNRGSLWVKTPAGWQLRFHQGIPRLSSNQI